MGNNLPDGCNDRAVDDAAAGRYGDDPCSYKVSCDMTGWGYVYVTASSAEEALEMASRGEHGDFDVMEWEVGEAKEAEVEG